MSENKTKMPGEGYHRRWGA